MKKQNLLKHFSYSIPAADLVFAELKGHHTAAEHLPLMKVAIDFENGLLRLEGDWQFMMTSNKHNEANWFTYHRERVKIETLICPALAINLNDPSSDGLVFLLEGSIKKSTCLSTCSGLLVIDKAYGSNDAISDQWNISFYLYDVQFDNCEIKFKLPVYGRKINSYLG